MSSRITQEGRAQVADIGSLYLGGNARATQVVRVFITAMPVSAIPITPPGGAKTWPPVWYASNEYDHCLYGIRRRARAVEMVEPCRRISWCGDDDRSERIPHGGKEWWESGSIVTPASLPTASTVVQFYVPTGYLGIIYGITLRYTGTGFVEGSGDIVWRVKVGNAWAAQGLGNCLFQLGTVGQCLSLTDYITAKSNQRVQVQVQVPNTSGLIQVGASRILATLQGWWYPL